MRGTRRHILRDQRITRFIPARAGNAPSLCHAPPSRPVHSRACGERLADGARLRLPLGSSQRMRGTLPRTVMETFATRFLPAHAETPGRPFRRPDRRQLTPAHAGNARPGGRRRARSPVHPRACGERLNPQAASSIDDGSSPRMWGTRDLALLRRQLFRFIPAHAENARRWSTGAIRASVHPRECGERMTTVCGFGPQTGSSPRMRGTLAVADWYDLRVRFIPAHAGDAPRAPAWQRPSPVHPRAGGERQAPSGRSPGINGSSPRMRGTLLRVGRVISRRRFIPAHAGNASGPRSRAP